MIALLADIIGTDDEKVVGNHTTAVLLLGLSLCLLGVWFGYWVRPVKGRRS